MKKASTPKPITKRGKAKPSALIIEMLIMQGGLMSNLCYNAKQNEALPAPLRASMDEAQTRWDKALNEYRNPTPEDKP